MDPITGKETQITGRKKENVEEDTSGWVWLLILCNIAPPILSPW